MNKKTIFSTSLVSVLLLALIILAACVPNATNSPSPTETTQPPTVTVVQYATVTVTATPSTTFVPTSIPTNYPDMTPSPVYDFKDFNNNRFYMAKETIGYNKSFLPDGTSQLTPVYKDIYVDLNQGGFKTIQDSIFVTNIPTITNHYDWFVRFKLPSVPSYKLPWTLNWGVETDSDDPDADVKFYLVHQYIFESNYYNNPDSITEYGTGNVKSEDRGVSELGEHCLLVNDGSGIYVALFRTDNPDSILGWWIKFGGVFN